MLRFSKKIIVGTAVAVCAIAFAAYPSVRDTTHLVRLNSVGFKPGFPKIATTADSINIFVIRCAGTLTNVFPESGTLPVGPSSLNSDTGEQLWDMDFTDFNGDSRCQNGYYIAATRGGGAPVITSPPFTVSNDAFREPFRALMLGMYLWRCGHAGGVSATYDGAQFSHGVCHLSDGSLQHANSGMGTGHKDGTRGWHDAGDYNKYIVNSGVTVGLMLKAWENFHPIIRDIPLINVQNSGSLPAFLAEIKWNLDWVEKMQFDDGRVSHKLTVLNFGVVEMPDEETTQRYFMPWSTAATGAFVSKMALASRIYRPFDEELADRYLEAARRSYDVLVDSDPVGPDNSVSSTGFYDSPNSDPGQRRWAAAEMWETTGEERYLEDLERLLRARAGDDRVREVTEWANVWNLASMTYLSSLRPGKDEDLVNLIRSRLITVADGIANRTQSHGYGRPVASYYWGVNGAVASTAYILNQAYRATGDIQYRHAIHAAVNHLLGKNYWGRSFVTRVGHNPPQNPYDRRSNASRRPWPGYLVGGPHTQAPEAMPSGASCTRAATCWFDSGTDYARNEVAINWNSAMIYALAAVLPGSEEWPAQCYPGQPYCEGNVSVRHTARQQQRGAPATNIRTARIVNTRGSTINIPPGASVYTLNGRLIARRGHNDARMPVIRQKGVFIMRIEETAK
ncbi:MAG: glycoside hydrolase family 9 protein [Chitinispirillales bacterium]|jgi:endoglucanase|nr:glycoside hydrolase family 9 protein [Chitinispirillales bacterium]